MELYLDKKIIENQQLSAKAISVYVGLRSIYKSNKSIYYVNPQMLEYSLANNLNDEVGYTRDMKEGLNELISKGVIDLVEIIGKSQYILDLSNLYLDSEVNYYIAVDDSNIFNVMDTYMNKHLLLRYYLTVLGTIVNNDTYDSKKGIMLKKDIGYMSQAFFIEHYGFTQTTIYNYNKHLAEKELLYFYKPVKYRVIEGNITCFPGTYGEYKNKDLILECGKEFELTFSGTSVNQISTYDMKSASCKYRYIRDAGKTYDYDTMENIYLNLRELNKKMKEKYHTEEDYNKYKKDLSVFKDYDFYVGE